MLFMYAVDQEFDEIELMTRAFQNTMTRARFSSVPVISADGFGERRHVEVVLHVDGHCIANTRWTVNLFNADMKW